LEQHREVTSRSKIGHEREDKRFRPSRRPWSFSPARPVGHNLGHDLGIKQQDLGSLRRQRRDFAVAVGVQPAKFLEHVWCGLVETC